MLGGKPETNNSRRQYIRFNFMMYIEVGEKKTQMENHLKRVQDLRKELTHIKETDWQYDSIEKHIGQS